MATRLTDPIPAESSCSFLVSFLDENSSPVSPKEASWSLMDKNGAIINFRKNVSLSPLAAICRITLTGLDLKPNEDFKKGVNQLRILRVKAIYDSIIMGTDVPLKGDLEFYVENPVAIIGETASASPSASVSPSSSNSPSPSPSVSPSASASPSA